MKVLQAILFFTWCFLLAGCSTKPLINIDDVTSPANFPTDRFNITNRELLARNYLAQRKNRVIVDIHLTKKSFLFRKNFYIIVK